jgi:phosphoribosylformylglycinamidine synthase
MWQFRQAIEGISAVCVRLEIPVVSGNVSFYNETRGLPIYPTPIIGMVGLLEDVSHVMTPAFKDEGDVLLLLGRNRNELGGSEFLKEIHHQVRGEPPLLDMGLEKGVQSLCLDLIRKGWVKSAHDLSEGGLAVALAECCMSGRDERLGAMVDLELTENPEEGSCRPDTLLFGESQSRILVSINPERLPDVESEALKQGVPLKRIGQVGGERLLIRKTGMETVWIDLTVDQMANIWWNAIPSYLEKTTKGP